MHLFFQIETAEAEGRGYLPASGDFNPDPPLAKAPPVIIQRYLWRHSK